MREERYAYRGYWWGSQNERDHLEGRNGGGQIILKWMLKK
jgi:hypothetical protein